MNQEIIFIHGMWTRPWVWDSWKARFEQAGFSCSTITLKGHAAGESDEALVGVGLADYAAQVHTAVSACAAPPMLVGHSLGGLIAQQVAERVPLAGIALITSAAPAPIFPLRPIMLPALVRHFARPRLWFSTFRLSRWEADHLIFNGLPKAERPAYYARLCAESGHLAYQVGFGPLNRSGSNRVRREAIRCPMLALAGVQDHIIPISVSRRMAAWYGEQLEYREFPQHAHWMLGEAGAEQRAEEVIAWIRQVGSQPQSSERAAP